MRAAPPSKSAPPRRPNARPATRGGRDSARPAGAGRAVGRITGTAGLVGAGALLGVRLDLLAVDLATPTLALATGALDEVLEALEITLHAALEEAERVTGRLDRAVGLGVDPKRDACLGRALRREQDGARVVRALDALPRNALVRRLVGDVRGPRLGLAGDVGRPAPRLVVDLLDALDALHEAREILELRPLVVGDAHGDVHDDGVLESRHGDLLLGRPHAARRAIRFARLRCRGRHLRHGVPLRRR